MTDFLEREFTLGCFVVGTHRFSNSLWLTVGKIVKLDPLTVQTATKHWNDQITVGRAAKIMRPDRLVIISESEVPKKYLDAFKQ